jgi:tRNA pseudouridine55 synthase
VLACGAHLTALCRTSVGSLSVAAAVTLEQLQLFSEEERVTCLLAPDTLLQTLPAVHLDEEAAARFMHGNAVSAIAPTGRCRVYGSTRLLGLADADAEGLVHPRRLVNA